MKLFNKTLVAVATGALMASSALFSAQAEQRKLVFYSDTSNPAPRAAFEELVADFEAAHPDIDVELTVIEREAFKTAIRNFLTAEAPDVATWYAGNRMRPFVEAGLFEPIDDLWESAGLNQDLASSASALTMNGQKWGVPYTYYQWGVYYRKDIFEANNIAVPTTWDEFLAAGETLKAAGVTPITIGTKFLWTAAGVFDYINMRTHGYDFHIQLANGEIPWTDPRVRETMANFQELIDRDFFVENHASLAWQEALPAMIQGDAAMYVMGNFAVEQFREGGLTDDQLGYFQFPEITPGLPKGEDAPMDTLHIPANAQNKADAKTFLAYVASADVQTKLNAALGQLPVNINSDVGDDKFMQAGFEVVSNAGGIAQFFDRDAPAEMANVAMEGFQEFMVKPDRLDRILDRLEKTRQRINGN